MLTIRNGKNQKAVECPEGEYPICGSGGEMGRASAFITKGDSVIIGRKGNISSPILMREPFWNVDTAFGLEPNEERLTVEYLYYFCERFNFEKLNKAVTIPSLTKADLLKIDMPLPPINLQREFTDRVVLIDNLKVLLENVKQALDDLVKSQFVEMFGELAPSVSLASICELFTDGDWIESKDQSIGGIRLLQTGNVGNGKFRNKGDKARYITGETFDRLQCEDVLAGDILISRLPDPVGRACAVPESLGRCITAVDCSILRLKPEWNVSFVVWFTRTADYENQIREYLTGTTRKRISRSNLGKIKIPAADSELQQQFADFVARVDKLGFGCCRMTTYCDTLFSSVSARLLRT